MHFLRFWEYLRVTLCRHGITGNRIVKRVVESRHGPFSPRHHRISATQHRNMDLQLGEYIRVTIESGQLG